MTSISRQIGEPLDTEDAIAIGNSKHIQAASHQGMGTGYGAPCRPERWIDHERRQQQYLSMSIIDDLNPKDTEVERLAAFQELYAEVASRPEVFPKLEHDIWRRRAVRDYINSTMKPNSILDDWIARQNAVWNAKPWHEKASIRLANKLSSARSRIRDAWAVLTGKADIGEW